KFLSDIVGGPHADPRAARTHHAPCRDLREPSAGAGPRRGFCRRHAGECRGDAGECRGDTSDGRGHAGDPALFLGVLAALLDHVGPRRVGAHGVGAVAEPRRRRSAAAESAAVVDGGVGAGAGAARVDDADAQGLSRRRAQRVGRRRRRAPVVAGPRARAAAVEPTAVRVAARAQSEEARFAKGADHRRDQHSPRAEGDGKGNSCAERATADGERPSSRTFLTAAPRLPGGSARPAALSGWRPPEDPIRFRRVENGRILRQASITALDS
ncbi:hypothetical protein M885DRAFT_622265, partial [Pelagophyceae sp. CCMP2097]